jgi:predicted DNA-binding WGR domain protein
MFSLREGENQNPYSWDFDLCSLTLGNFNYRKMTLVRDYAKLIETDMASSAFDAVFSLSPKPSERAAPALPLGEQHLIVACDATQASAIARARTGESYIIQGPPGTGKSQTITNLIGDYVARGKRVLFVCEKRAAIDVVFHRLRQQGMDELCCLIHDSQTDKKAFIQNLKQTYEKLLSQEGLDAEAAKSRKEKLRRMEEELSGLDRFSEAMRRAHPPTGISLRALLHRLVTLPRPARELPAATQELLPEYPTWLEHGQVAERLRGALTELRQNLCFAKHPLRWLGREVLRADRPAEVLSACLDEAEDLLDGIENALELSGLPAELWDTFEEIEAILEYALRLQPLAERDLLKVLSDAEAARRFDALALELDTKAQRVSLARQKTSRWKERLGPEDTQNALAAAEGFEKSWFRFLQPNFWRLKKAIEQHYDFAKHAVPPPWTKLLKDLASEHEAQAAFDKSAAEARREWGTEDLDGFRGTVAGLRKDVPEANPSVQALVSQLAKSDQAEAVIENLCEIQGRFAKLSSTLAEFLAEHQQFDFPELAEVLAKLREHTPTLADLSPILGDVAELPEGFMQALRKVEVPLDKFEGAIGHKSIQQVYRRDRALNRFESRVLGRKMEELQRHYRDWLGLNARTIRAGVRQRFLEHVNLASLAASQLEAEQKIFKKVYTSGRRDLEHEFGKSMRYKSIRDLAAGDTGRVIQDLKPIWLMSPLSVSDTLPLDPELFDVVIFDEASQIPLEEAIPAIYRSHQVIIVGDEMQLPPTTFFAAARKEEESVSIEEDGERVEVDLDADSFLTKSAQNLPSTLLAWHYRSRYESLISFSNAAFYTGKLFTIPDRRRALQNQPEIRVNHPEEGRENAAALLARSISFHFVGNGVYEDRSNAAEASYIAEMTRALLCGENKLSIGVVAFSEAQQTEIENALNRLAAEDSEFGARLEAEYGREENDVFCGFFVKNLENVQGDERDIIIMSVCYGHDSAGRLLMNFGPINQSGGERRLNVIFSRAKSHMAVVTSIRHDEITNDYNDGANSLKNFLHYAEAVSRGDLTTARRVLENLNPLSRKALAPPAKSDAVVEQIAAALRSRGHSVDENIGQSKFRCDLAVRSETDEFYELGILVDTEEHYANPDLLDRYLMQPSILRAFGWRVTMVLTKDWYEMPEEVLARLEKLIKGLPIGEPEEMAPESGVATAEIVRKPGKVESKNLVGSAPKVTPLAGEPRYFEFTSGASKKFWEISTEGKSFTVRFGRIGTSGQAQTKSFPSETQAKREAERLVAEKVSKGYVERSA